MIHGCDLSHYNPTPANFLPWSFAFLRASYGLTVDESAERHAAQARATAPLIQLGVYHYLTDRSGHAQADLLLTREASLGGDLLLAVDVEDLPEAPPWPRAMYAVCLLDFVQRITARERRCFVYASHAFVVELLAAAPVTMREVAKLAPLWLADWTAPYPTPLPWATHAILQDGLKHGVDHDVFDGTVDELRSIAGLPEVTLTDERRRTLRKDSTGADVHALQRLLNVSGAGLRTDGVFGPATERAVVAYQCAHGLVVDGIVGRETWTALLATPA